MYKIEVKPCGNELGVVFKIASGKTETYSSESSLVDRIAVLEETLRPSDMEKEGLQVLQAAKASGPKF